MKALSTKPPIIFGAILFLVGILAAGIIMNGFVIIGLPDEASGALARIIVGLILAGVFHDCISWKVTNSGMGLALPALIVVAFNIVYHLVSGMELVSARAIPDAIVAGCAPAIFEEVLFRGIVMGKMRDNGSSPTSMLWMPAALFAAIHLTNAVGMDLPSVLVQVGYSFVIGLFLGTIYLRSQDIEAVILAHAAIDVSNQIFTASPTSADVPMICAFCAVLVILTAYALWLAKGLAQDGE